MGREVRRVALGWTPPEHSHFDKTFAHAVQVWTLGKAAWESGADPDAAKYPQYTYEEWNGECPDDPEYYRPEWPEGTPLGYCLYETVTEGSALSPVFETAEELAQWMASNEIWGARYTLEQARSFVAQGWAPSFVMMGGQFQDGVSFVADHSAGGAPDA